MQETVDNSIVYLKYFDELSGNLTSNPQNNIKLMVIIAITTAINTENP